VGGGGKVVGIGARWARLGGRRQVRSPVVEAAVDAGLSPPTRGQRIDGGGEDIVEVAHLVAEGAVGAQEVVREHEGARQVFGDPVEPVDKGGSTKLCPSVAFRPMNVRLPAATSW